jgi:serine/threonine protein kinase
MIEKEREIFETAMELGETERLSYLAQVCGSDQSLHQRMLDLIQAHRDAGEFLEISALEQIPLSHEGQLANTIELVTGRASNAKPSSGDFEHDTAISQFFQPTSHPQSLGRIDHYEIKSRVGIGGFGTVFQAFDEKLQRTVAIKFLNPEMASTSPPRKRFLREARAVAAIRHENVVQIYNVEEEPIPYLVMEFIEGKTLQDRIDENGPLETKEILSIGKQLAAGLAAAHSIGIIHRDIKPANILVEAGKETKIKLTDFGLARTVDDASMTRTGVVAGTPMYMAPEQVLGNSLDERADLFSVGSVLYHIASGRPPFRASSTMAVLHRVAHESPRKLKEIVPDIPDWLQDLVERLHAKKPEDRLSSARELAELLSRYESEWLIHGRVSSFPTNRPLSQTTPKRLLGRRGIIVMAIVAIATTLAVLPWFYRNGNNVTNQTADGQINSQSPSSGSVEARRPLPSEFILSDEYSWSKPINLGPNINSKERESCPSITADECLIVFSRKGVFWEARRLDRTQPFGPAKKLRGPFVEQPAADSTCSLSGDGLTIAFESGALGKKESDIYLATRMSRDEPFGAAVHLPPGINTDSLERHPILSADGLTLAFTTDRNAHPRGSIMTVTRSSPTEPFLGEPTLQAALYRGWGSLSSFSSDGRGVLKTSFEKDVEVVYWHGYDPDLKQFHDGVRIKTTFGDRAIGQPVLSADGQSLYFHSRVLPGGSGDLDIWVISRVRKTTLE